MILFIHAMLSTWLILAVCRMGVTHEPNNGLTHHRVLCCSEVEHRSVRSERLRFNSSRKLKTFSLSRPQDKRITLFFKSILLGQLAWCRGAFGFQSFCFNDSLADQKEERGASPFRQIRQFCSPRHYTEHTFPRAFSGLPAFTTGYLRRFPALSKLVHFNWSDSVFLTFWLG